jgi:hypothetical protein
MAPRSAHPSQIDNDAISQGAKDPTIGMSGFEKFAAGAGKAVHDMGQGIGQLVGLSESQGCAGKPRQGTLR